MSDTISLRRFARDASALTQPTQVRQGDEILGTFTPKGWPPVALGPTIATTGHLTFGPTPRSAPVIPSGSLVVGTAETDRAQTGVPEPSSRGFNAARQSGSEQAAAPHEPGGVQNAAPLGSSPLAIIPPKPAGYVHDPHFNSKGSRPVPKVRK